MSQQNPRKNSGAQTNSPNSTRNNGTTTDYPISTTTNDPTQSRQFQDGSGTETWDWSNQNSANLEGNEYMDDRENPSGKSTGSTVRDMVESEGDKMNSSSATAQQTMNMTRTISQGIGGEGSYNTEGSRQGGIEQSYYSEMDGGYRNTESDNRSRTEQKMQGENSYSNIRNPTDTISGMSSEMTQDINLMPEKDYQQPNSGAQTSWNGNQQSPNESQQLSDGFQQTPSGFQQTPDGSQLTPNSFQQTPSGSQLTPNGFQQTPSGFQQTPDGSQLTPSGFQQTPDGSQRTPNSFQQTPSGFQQTPDGSQLTPNSFQQTTSGFQQTPDGSQLTPNSFQQTPSGFQQTPDGSQQTPSGFQQTSDGFQQTPGGFQQTPSGFQQTSYSFQQSLDGFQQPPDSFQQSLNSFQQPPDGFQQFPNDNQQSFDSFQQSYETNQQSSNNMQQSSNGMQQLSNGMQQFLSYNQQSMSGIQQSSINEYQQSNQQYPTSGMQFSLGTVTDARTGATIQGTNGSWQSSRSNLQGSTFRGNTQSQMGSRQTCRTRRSQQGNTQKSYTTGQVDSVWQRGTNNYTSTYASSLSYGHCDDPCAGGPRIFKKRVPRKNFNYDDPLNKRCPCGCCAEQVAPNICGINFTRWRELNPEDCPLMVQGHATDDFFPSLTCIEHRPIHATRLFQDEPKCYNPPPVPENCFGGGTIRKKKFPCGKRGACCKASCGRC